jgi:hypothetical protein
VNVYRRYIVATSFAFDPTAPITEVPFFEGDSLSASDGHVERVVPPSEANLSAKKQEIENHLLSKKTH